MDHQCELCAPWLHLGWYEAPNLRIWVRLYSTDGSAIVQRESRECWLDYRPGECAVLANNITLRNEGPSVWVSDHQVVKVSGLPVKLFQAPTYVFDHNDPYVIRSGESMTFDFGGGGVVATPWV